MITKAQRVMRVERLKHLLMSEEKLTTTQLSQRTGLSTMAVLKIAERLGLLDRVIKRKAREFTSGDCCH